MLRIHILYVILNAILEFIKNVKTKIFHYYKNYIINVYKAK